MAKQYDDFEYDFENEDFAPAGFKPKRKNDQETVTWKDAWMALGSFLLAMGLISLISFFAQHIFLRDVYEAYANSYSSYSSYSDYGSYANPFSMGAYSSIYTEPLFMGISIAVSLVITLIQLLVMYGIMHMVATLLNGGNGTLRGLIYRGNSWTFGVYIVLSIISTVAAFIWMDDILAATQAMATGAEPSAYLSGMMQYMGVQYSAYFIGWAVWLYGMSGVLAKNYHYETSSGCITLAVSHIVYVVAYIAFSLIVGMLFVGLMFSAM